MMPKNTSSAMTNRIRQITPTIVASQPRIRPEDASAPPSRALFACTRAIGPKMTPRPVTRPTTPSAIAVAAWDCARESPGGGGAGAGM